MIGHLKGKALELKTNQVLIDINGVGYLVKISLNTYSCISGNPDVSLNIHTYVKEDRIELYGFSEKDEKSAFETLIKINGVGPNVALAILSGLTVAELSAAVTQKDYSLLVKVPGIGRTKAEKIILDLQRKIKDLGSKKDSGLYEKNSVLNDAVESMIALGFDEKLAKKTVQSVFESDSSMDIENLVRKSLSEIKK